ncbi:hypothetical protein [Agrococcus sp. Ld7]|uniref:hypothetical protein n=1 Tax=Agrococcus sp. Ld7 TaxID=649148 RepID=UPI00386A3AB7
MTAIVYCPEIHPDDLEYALADEIAWCLEGIDLEPTDESILRDALARTIIDPTAHRSTLNRVLDVLTDDAAA